jgi:hypothetical protein
MPLKWKRGVNPYIFNYFGKLRVGPESRPVQIVEQAKKLCKLLQAGETIELAGEELDEHALSEASSKLREPGPLAEELLLVHHCKQASGRQTKKLVDRLHKLITVPNGRTVPKLRDPLAIFWLLPAPREEAAELPPWSDLGLVEPGDAEDLELDIVFDC